MILVLVLSLFLSLTYYTINSLQSSTELEKVFRKVYQKEQALIFLDSLIPKVLELLRREDSTFDALTDPWARPYTFETEMGKVSITIIDEDRFLNPNKIREVKGLDMAFLRLLRLLEINPLLLDYILVWTGQEEGSLAIDFPIKRAPLDTVYEIELFWKNKEDLYGSKDKKKEGLFNFISVFTDGKVNVNTAPLPVLIALDEDITPEVARRITERREEAPFKRIKDLVLVEGISLDTLYRIEEMVKVNSRFFRLILTLERNESSLLELTIIYDRKENKILYKEVR